MYGCRRREDDLGCNLDNPCDAPRISLRALPRSIRSPGSVPDLLRDCQLRIPLTTGFEVWLEVWCAFLLMIILFLVRVENGRVAGYVEGVGSM